MSNLMDTELGKASRFGHTERVKILLDQKANVHPDNDYPIRLACDNGHTY